LEGRPEAEATSKEGFLMIGMKGERLDMEGS